MPEHQNKSVAVENLQRYLRRLSFREPSIVDPPIDGIFDSRTEEALRGFQRLKGLPVTGKADRETWDLLYRDYRRALAEGDQPRKLALFPIFPDGYILSEGNQDFSVRVLQYMLRELHHLHKELEDVEQTGIYDAQTAKAVKLFQKRNFLTEDGVVGLLTWNAIADAYNVLFSRFGTE